MSDIILVLLESIKQLDTTSLSPSPLSLFHLLCLPLLHTHAHLHMTIPVKISFSIHKLKMSKQLREACRQLPLALSFPLLCVKTTPVQSLAKRNALLSPSIPSLIGLLILQQSIAIMILQCNPMKVLILNDFLPPCSYFQNHKNYRFMMGPVLLTLLFL